MTPEQELYQLEPRAIVSLYEIDLRPIGYDRIIRFCDSALGTPITYRGERYAPWPMALSKVEIAAEGPIPAPVLEIANRVPADQAGTTFYTGVVSELLQVYDPVEALFVRRRIFKQNLDDGMSPDPSQEFEPLVLEIDSYDIKHDVCRIQMISELAKLNLDWPPESIAAVRDSE